VAADSRVTGLSLVLPAFDEEEAITAAVDEARTALAGLAREYEILVVDDGSRDATAQRVRALAAHDPAVRLLQHPVNRGYGAALRTGFAAARCDLIAFTDADSQFHVDDLARLLPRLEGSDVVCGYRVDRSDSAVRRFYSWGYNRLIRALLGLPVRDCDCALKLFRAEALRAVEIETRGFLVNAELLTKLRLRGSSIAEVGVRHRPRAAGRSTVSPWHILPVAAALLRFWWCWMLFPAAATRRVAAEEAAA
jgi:dolichol-phosphate mannosyltransferase